MFVGTLLSPLLGTLGDRVGLRRVLASMRQPMRLLAGVILLLALGGSSARPGGAGVAFVVGMIKPSDIGLRTALVSATVPARSWWRPWASRAPPRIRPASAVPWPAPASWPAWAWPRPMRPSSRSTRWAWCSRC
jgi:hypothetical protein